MIGKVITGRSFGGCIAYNLQREEASILYAEGVRTTSVSNMIDDFNLQRKLNPNLGQAVGHIVLSWSATDKPKLTSEIIIERTQEYMLKMKIKDTQYVIVQHTDRQHPHVHLVYNRVANDGKTIPDRYQKVRNAKVCKELTMKYGYHLAKGKSAVNRQRLKGADQVKYQLHDAIRASLLLANNWSELESLLAKRNIEVHYKYLSGSNTVQGVSFSKGETKFKGSDIDRSLSFMKINEHMVQKQQKAARHQYSTVSQIKHEGALAFQSPSEASTSPSLLSELLKSEQLVNDDVQFEFSKRRHKRRKGQRL